MALEGTLQRDFEVETPSEAVSLSLSASCYTKEIFSEDEDERTEQYRALIGVTTALETAFLDPSEAEIDTHPFYVQHLFDFDNVYFEGSPVIRDQELVGLVLNNADRTEDIMDFITERHAADPEAIRSYLNDYHRTLSSGTL